MKFQQLSFNSNPMFTFKNRWTRITFQRIFISVPEPLFSSKWRI